MTASGSRHNARDGSGKFAPKDKAARAKHTTSADRTAQIQPAPFRPHQPVQAPQTAGVNPDRPAQRKAAQNISPNVPYLGDSPTGYAPYTMGTF